VASFFSVVTAQRRTHDGSSSLEFGQENWHGEEGRRGQPRPHRSSSVGGKGARHRRPSSARGRAAELARRHADRPPRRALRGGHATADLAQGRATMARGRAREEAAQAGDPGWPQAALGAPAARREPPTAARTGRWGLAASAAARWPQHRAEHGGSWPLAGPRRDCQVGAPGEGADGRTAGRGARRLAGAAGRHVGQAAPAAARAGRCAGHLREAYRHGQGEGWEKNAWGGRGRRIREYLVTVALHACDLDLGKRSGSGRSQEVLRRLEQYL
jgi:hypothetical protein